MLLHSIVYACRCARVQAEFEAVEAEDLPVSRFFSEHSSER